MCFKSGHPDLCWLHSLKNWSTSLDLPMLCRVLLDANSGEHQLRLIEIHPRWFQKVFRAKRWLNMHENALLKSNMEPESSKVFFQDFEPTSTSVLESFPLFF